MELTTLGNRPAQLAPLSKIEDFTDGGAHFRVSLTLEQASPDILTIKAQAFAVDASGAFLPAPDGKPSRTPETAQNVIASGLTSGTHTLQPGWVRKVGTYTEADFTATGQGKPTGTGSVGDEYFDTDSEIGYRWDEGETLRIARGKVEEMQRILANSPALAGISF